MRDLSGLENQALEAFNAGNLKKAKKLYYKLIDLSPKSSQYFERLGECHQRLGELQLAENCGRRVSILNKTQDPSVSDTMSASSPSHAQNQGQAGESRGPNSSKSKAEQVNAASLLFNLANENWRQRQSCVLRGDKEGALKASIEVIRLCQLAIHEFPWKGDAYVMLSNALSVEEDNIVGTFDQGRHDFLQSRAAAIIQKWCSLPHRDYPTTKNSAIGKQLWKSMIEEIQRDKALPEKGAKALMESYMNSMAAETLSPEYFESLKSVVLNDTTREQHRSQTDMRPQDALPGAVETSDTHIGANVSKESNSIDNPLIVDAAESAIRYYQAVKASGVDEASASDDIVNASHNAELAASKDPDNKVSVFWRAFFHEFSAKCNDRCLLRFGNSNDTSEFITLWLNLFEPLWIAGCTWKKDLAVEGFLKLEKDADSTYAGQANADDLLKIKEYTRTFAQKLNQDLASAITEFTMVQRKSIFETIRDNHKLFGMDFNEQQLKQSLSINY